MLRAGADITFVPLDATRSVVFELNGSLKVESIEKDGKASDRICSGCGRSGCARTERPHRPGSGGAGESTDNAAYSLERRADLAGRWTTGDEATGLRWHEGSYLMYASRWFPFHDYAADRATSDITFIVPTGLQVAGTSDDPVVAQPAPKEGAVRYRFVHRQPVLIGNFAAGQYINRNLRFGNYRSSALRDAGQRKANRSICRTDRSCARVLLEAIRRTAVWQSPGRRPDRRREFRHLLGSGNHLPVVEDVRLDAARSGREA